MCIRRHNHQVGLGINLGRSAPQRRQQQQRHEERSKHIHGNGAFKPLGQLPKRSDQGHRRIFDDHVQAGQLGRAATELFHALKAAKIQGPNLHSIAPPRRALDVGPGAFALVGVATRQDYPTSVQPGEVPRCLETESDICTCDDDCLAGEFLFWFRKAPELVAEECDEKLAVVAVSMCAGRDPYAVNQNLHIQGHDESGQPNEWVTAACLRSNVVHGALN